MNSIEATQGLALRFPRLQRVGFSLALIVVTLVPLAAILFTYHVSPIGAVVSFFVIAGSTHVFCTLYLLSDKDVRRFVRAHPVKMIAAPIALMVVGLFLFSRPNPAVFVPGIFAYILYSAWHFGAQNIGVATFISLSERGRSLSRLEKNLIRLCVICGMVGVLRISHPDFTVGRQFAPVSAETLAVLTQMRDFGMIFAAGLTVVAAAMALDAWRRGHVLFGIGIFLSMTFLFPMYVTTDYMLGFGSFITAHGLQYLVFLGAHSLGSGGRQLLRPAVSTRTVLLVAAPVLLLLTALVAHQLWSSAPKFAAGSLTSLGTSLVLGFTLAHFWFDQFLWKMTDKDRASWAKDRYAFVFNRG